MLVIPRDALNNKMEKNWKDERKISEMNSGQIRDGLRMLVIDEDYDENALSLNRLKTYLSLLCK